ncbi:chemotaxis-specific protein-glutamate methyltransferase CheB [Bacillus cereus]|uniref:Protein-glutamate methylesterase/protein-glutamine glutaminase n=1 Tax=Bacillus cereus TaxID=1396 RepID=A0A164QF57_BACCE|nr:chemotaxis-specific protein-glutamate methyltransferase CheB [Bacillus cereus]KZD71230.1 Chemotaxis response regulator protein-glutamate methylesterase CheB [Bacillus cereus]HDR8323167.1 chemotaxis-specific protein-glutamate methyltransferase CheB [Bacillus cereus]HDR8330252.1 chemotaxis-specific protein-glutamate methyltransferase CheB [Bacillus cereus]HDR8334303.1 chemotaxis-specific protein-glutamate methyltransferase CheB [Bacillus cereus]
MKKNKLNVMLVDDSFIIRVILKDLLEEDPQKRFNVLERVDNGEKALYAIKAHMGEIDVVIMDIEMPVMNGLEAVKKIMKECPVPIVMFSSLTKRGAQESIEAMRYGAVDVIAKPDGNRHMSAIREEIYNKLEYAGKYANVKNLRTPLAPVRTPDFSFTTKRNASNKLSNLIVIGSSTGGPNALRTMFSTLPAETPAGIIVVQHMPQGPFVKSIADRLDETVPFRVKIAEEGEIVEDGTIYFADAGKQLGVKKERGNLLCHYTDDDPITGHKPSVTYLFESVANENPDVPVYSIVATGMGSDGARGLQPLKQIGSTNLVESPDTTVIYGMPRKAKETGFSDYEERIEQLIPRICDLISKPNNTTSKR